MVVRVKELKAAKISVRGVVQGVGFRPFIYRLARAHSLAGWVCNTSGSVEIEVEGEGGAVEAFIDDLRAKAPPMARLKEVVSAPLQPQGHADFRICQSQAQEGVYQLVSPDIATCDDCRREIMDPSDRRFGYAFTNCTNCGPRFTIIEDIPYDRPKTTMRRFKMCPRCQWEYEDPLDRRFHAQPNACPVCGPALELVDDKGQVVACDDIIAKAADILRQGYIVALRGLGGFQLACDASSDQAVARLRSRKRRPAKPFAVMLKDIEGVRQHCQVSQEEEALLQSPQAPIVLLKWRRGASAIAKGVGPVLKYLGVMLPYTPLHHLLMKQGGIPLVMTSGNLSEEPIAKDNDEALKRLGGIADYFLMHNRDIYARYDDSVYMVEEGEPRALRRARGHAPYPVFLPFKAKEILACGAEEKNTFCLTKDDHAFLSQHIGDMENEETLEHFQDTIDLYKQLFRIEPKAIAYDLHPEYLSTKYALQAGLELGIRTIPVQHHHAHIASCMVENDVTDPVIGVAFDGTGYGTDGTLWGGEFLLADLGSFERVGHLECLPLAGGAAAIKRPRRLALGYIKALTGEGFSTEGLPLGDISPQEVDIITKQVQRGINSPLTSSAGRLFDCVAALSGVRGEIQYEAQAAIELEMAAPDDVEMANVEPYPFKLVEGEGVKVIGLSELIAAVMMDVREGVEVGVISLRFHRTVAELIAETCCAIRRERGVEGVALSGGVFQNRLLLRTAAGLLKRCGFRVLTHRLVPTNDGGISLGQAVVANYKL